MLEALGNLGDFLGGLAVIITLIYVAAQVRQNTAAVRSASRLEIASSWRAAGRLLLDPEVAHAYAQGLREYPDMPFKERIFFNAVIADHAVFFQGVFALHQAGQLDGETYNAYLDWFACNVATPGGSAWWAEIGRPILVKSPANAVEARLAEGRLPDITQLSFNRPDGSSPTPAPDTASSSTPT